MTNNTENPSTPTEVRPRPLAWSIAGGLTGLGLAAIDTWHTASVTGDSQQETSLVMALAWMLFVPLALVGGGLTGVFFRFTWRWLSPKRMLGYLRSPKIRWLLLAGIIAFAVAIYVLGNKMEIDWRALDLWVPIVGLAACLAFALLVWKLNQRGVRLLVGTLIILVGSSVGSAVMFTQGGPDKNGVLSQIAAHSWGIGPLFEKVSSLFDGDGDSYPTWLCEAGCDCDDSNPSIHPGAKDIADNGIDEDCSGKDASAASKKFFF